jgi:hypothetical protein
MDTITRVSLKFSAALTLIPPSKSAYGSHFLIANLPQVHKVEFNEANMYSLSFLWRFLIYLLNCLKPLLSIVIHIFKLQNSANERLFIPQGVGLGCRLLKNDNMRDLPYLCGKKVPPIHPLIVHRVFSAVPYM